MRHFTMTREFYIPAGAAKVTDKRSDAVAYLYATSNGAPAVAVFYGKQAKPAARYKYKNDQARVQAVTRFFEHRRQILDSQAARRAERNAKPRKAEVGAVYYTSWGYDQTNIDYYEVVELVGTKSARVRKIGGMDVSSPDQPYMTGKSIPCAGAYRGEPLLVRFTGDSFKVDGHYAHRWNGQPNNWTAYA